MAAKIPHVEPIMTAPTDDPKREVMVLLRGPGETEVVRAYWWHHWGMPDGRWWCPERGVVYPEEWIVE